MDFNVLSIEKCHLKIKKRKKKSKQTNKQTSEKLKETKREKKERKQRNREMCTSYLQNDTSQELMLLSWCFEPSQRLELSNQER